MVALVSEDDTSKEVEPEVAASLVVPPNKVKDGKRDNTKDQLSPFASVKLSVFLMCLMALTILIGAGCHKNLKAVKRKSLKCLAIRLPNGWLGLVSAILITRPGFLL